MCPAQVLENRLDKTMIKYNEAGHKDSEVSCRYSVLEYETVILISEYILECCSIT